MTSVGRRVEVSLGVLGLGSLLVTLAGEGGLREDGVVDVTLLSDGELS